MKKKIILFLAVILILNPVLAFASEIEVPEPGKILQATDLNYPGSIIMARSCIKWEETCTNFTTVSNTCTTECVAWDDGSTSYSSGSGEISEVGYIIGIIGIAIGIGVIIWAFTPND